MEISTRVASLQGSNRSRPSWRDKIHADLHGTGRQHERDRIGARTMKRLVLCLSALIFWPGTAFATTWNPSDKSTGISLSGGNLTATAAATDTYKTVRATDGKFSG